MLPQTRILTAGRSLVMAAIWGMLLSILLGACGQDKKNEAARQPTPTQAAWAGLQVGDAAPFFSLPASDGSTGCLPL
jgi:hypothetical protein